MRLKGNYLGISAVDVMPNVAALVELTRGKAYICLAIRCLSYIVGCLSQMTPTYYTSVSNMGTADEVPVISFYKVLERLLGHDGLCPLNWRKLIRAPQASVQDGMLDGIPVSKAGDFETMPDQIPLNSVLRLGALPALDAISLDSAEAPMVSLPRVLSLLQDSLLQCTELCCDILAQLFMLSSNISECNSTSWLEHLKDEYLKRRSTIFPATSLPRQQHQPYAIESKLAIDVSPVTSA